MSLGADRPTKLSAGLHCWSKRKAIAGIAQIRGAEPSQRRYEDEVMVGASLGAYVFRLRVG
jgi:hypothetical protein